MSYCENVTISYCAAAGCYYSVAANICYSVLTGGRGVRGCAVSLSAASNQSFHPGRSCRRTPSQRSTCETSSRRLFQLAPSTTSTRCSFRSSDCPSDGASSAPAAVEDDALLRDDPCFFCGIFLFFFFITVILKTYRIGRKDAICVVVLYGRSKTLRSFSMSH